MAKRSNKTMLEVLAELPDFPLADIRDSLPAPLRDLVDAIDDRDEKAVAVVGGLGLLSGALPNLEGVYAQRMYAPSLFVVVTAPAGTGKGALGHARKLAGEIERHFEKEHQDEMAAYNERQHQQ